MIKDVNELYLYYEEKLKPIIDMNIIKLKLFRRIDIVCALVVAAIALWFGVYSRSFIPFMIAVPPLFYFLFKKQTKFAYPDYRSKLLNGIVTFMDEGFKYRSHDSIGKYSFDKSGIRFNRVHKYDVSDIISGGERGRAIRLAFIKGYKFNFPKGVFAVLLATFFSFFIILSFVFTYSDMSLWRIVLISCGITFFIIFFMIMGKALNGKHGTDSDWVVLSKLLYREDERVYIGKMFEGLFLSMEFNKKFMGRTIGMTRSFTEQFLSADISDFMEEVDLENADFMEDFRVYSTDQQEARYLLTPLLMESLYGLKQRLGRPMNFSFAGSKLFITFEMEDLLELATIDKVDSFDKIAELYVSLSDIMQTAGYLGLDRRIWTKM